MIRRALLLALLFAAPAILPAQRGGGSRSGKRDEMFSKADKGPLIRPREVEDQSPLKLLIDKKKDLKLTDAQVGQFKEFENKLKDKNESLMKAVDSLGREMSRTGGGNATADSLRNDSSLRRLRVVIANIQANYDVSATEAIATLDNEQKTKANELVTKQREDADKMYRSKLGVERP